MTVEQALQLAVQHHAAGRLPEAEELYRQALRIRPNDPTALHNLGQMALSLHQYDVAVDLLQQACAADPADTNVHNTLGAALFAIGRTREAEIACRQAIQLDPHFSHAYANLGHALAAMGDFAGAIDAFRKAIGIDPNHAIAHDGLGFVLLLLGDLQQGWLEQEWRWLKTDFEKRRFADLPQWDGSDISGKTLLLAIEQGYGDVFQFCRYVPLLAARGAKVVLEVVPEIYRLMSSLGGVHQLLVIGNPPPLIDVVSPLLSVPLWFGTAMETIPADVPYLSADSRLAESFAATHFNADPNRKVGLVWAGRPAHRNNHNRSTRLADLLPLADIPGISFYGLQTGEAAKEISSLAANFSVVDLSPDLPDFSATAAAIAGLDLIITVDTAVAHLAGAMGKPVWILLPLIPDWRWLLDREDSPWYPTVRLFRQRSVGNWAEVVKSVASSLGDFFISPSDTASDDRAG